LSSTVTITTDAAAPARSEIPRAGSRAIPPLLPLWLPLIVAACVTGILFAWLFPSSTSGGSAPAARFTDITEASGIVFSHHTGADADDTPTTIGGGVVFFDFDADGDPDLFFVNGSVWPWEETFAKRASRGGCALFRNDGSGHFTDVSAAAEVNIEFQGMAAAAGDFDHDGLPDLFVTGVGANHLFHNRGDGKFEDVTEDAGLATDGDTWDTGATWIDYDADGRLDLVVCHYARWPHDVGLAGAFSVALMGHSYGTPTGFIGAMPSVYRNAGDGHFAVVRDSAGLRTVDPLTGLPLAKALAVVPVDANADGKLDLLFSFHTSESLLFLNQGDGTFAPRAMTTGERREGGSAGLTSVSALPFLRSDGVDERFAILRNATPLAGIANSENGNGDENENGNSLGVRLDSRFGFALLDYDRDGRIDVFDGNGVIEPDVNRFESGRNFTTMPQVLWNRSGDSWEVAPAAADSAWKQPFAARGVAVADIDGDGDEDVVMTQSRGSPVVLRNDQRHDLPWLAIDLVATRSAREAGGARVEVETPRRVYAQVAAPAMGFMAQSSSTLLFGLGDDARVRKVVVQWPGGHRQEIRPEAINRRITIVEE
jgi:hypothetical protein